MSKQGGALKMMLPAFRLGLGGPVGDGRQFWSWVTLEDVVGAFVYALTNDALNGAANVVAPQVVRCAEFAHELGRALHRPALIPLPAFVVRTVFGEMGDALLLASARVEAVKLQAAGFRFMHPELPEALRAVLA